VKLLVFEIDQASGKIRCKECFEADPLKTEWITRAAAKRHLEVSNEHVMNTQANSERRAADAAHHQNISATYSSLSYSDFNTSEMNPTPSSRPALFDANNDILPNDNNIFRFMDDFIIPAGVAPLTDDPSLEHERLRREVELLMMEAEQIDTLGPEYADDDATITNIVDDLHSFRMFHSLCYLLIVHLLHRH
jgi:hypothetical protein